MTKKIAKIEKIINKLLRKTAYSPLRRFVVPFLAPLFTIVNYFGFIDSKMAKGLKRERKVLLFATILYFIMTFYFAVHQVVYGLKHPEQSSH
jgi:hypothetical protein